jgi:LemA protein
MATILILGVIFVIALIFFGAGVGMYNALVTLRNETKSAFAQIDVQLQRRYDLIPNLVNVAKRYMKHERETLEAVIKARNAACDASARVASDPTDPSAMKSLVGAEGSLGSVLGRLFALSESYPELKADTQMSSMMKQLGETENSVSYARQAYNDAVLKYNTKREVFPSSIIAGIFNFKEAELFEVESQEIRRAPKVDFD